MTTYSWELSDQTEQLGSFVRLMSLKRKIWLWEELQSNCSDLDDRFRQLGRLLSSQAISPGSDQCGHRWPWLVGHLLMLVELGLLLSNRLLVVVEWDRHTRWLSRLIHVHIGISCEEIDEKWSWFGDQVGRQVPGEWWLLKVKFWGWIIAALLEGI